MWRNCGRQVARAAAVLVILILPFAMFAEFLIGSGVRNYNQVAQAHFPGKRVEALIAMVECQTFSVQDRNNAVWTLGQLDDPRAISVLEEYHVEERRHQAGSLTRSTLQIVPRHLKQYDGNRYESVLWRWMLPTED